MLLVNDGEDAISGNFQNRWQFYVLGGFLLLFFAFHDIL